MLSFVDTRLRGYNIFSSFEELNLRSSAFICVQSSFCNLNKVIQTNIQLVSLRLSLAF